MKSWFTAVITLDAVLMPAGVIDLLLFLYPSPPERTVIDSIIFLSFTAFMNWIPDPKDVKTIVLIPETASPWVGCNLMVVNPTWDTKYDELVVSPPTTSWFSEI